MPHLTDIRKRVDRLVDDTLRDSRFFRVESTVKGTARSPVISVYLDSDEGINIGDCATLSRDLHDRIEASGWCPEGFDLNVSSPGLDRSLRLPRQYVRHIGRNVRFEIQRSGTSTTVEGRLVEAGEEDVRLEGPEGEITVPFASIRTAVVRTPW
jgi:ribosome maturation factor RimP